MSDLIWHTEKRKIKDLIPYEHNPRQMNEKQTEDLKKSLEKFNLVEIPAINSDGLILAGHQRLKIMQLLGRGAEEIDVRVPNRKLTEPEVKEYNIRSNKNTGQWDFDILGSNFDLSELQNWGFDPSELNIPLPIKEDEAPDVNKESEPTSQYGDIFELGKHRLMCGDATKVEDIEKIMDGKDARMVFTDPPYNVDYSGGMHADGTQSKRRKILNDKMKTEEFYSFLHSMISNIMPVTSGAFYICMSSSELHNLHKAFTDAGGHWQTYVIWAKNAFTLSRSDYQHQFEPILYGLTEDEAKKAEANQENFDALPILYGWKKHDWYGGRKQGDVWFFDKPSSSKDHPTMKPIGLCAKAIKNSSAINDIVLDVFGGSGSTLIACEQTQRKCYTMELDPRYVDVIIKRWEQFTGEKARKI